MTNLEHRLRFRKRQKRAKKIEFVLSCVPESIEGKSKVEGLKIKSKKTGEVKELPVTGVFVAIGIIPESDAVKGKGMYG